MNRIKLCHVITRMIIGGAQENTLYTVEGLAGKPGYDVTLVTGTQTGPEGDLSGRIHPSAPYRRVAMRSLRRAINPLFDLAALVRLYRFFRKERFQVVHTHSSKAGILARFAASMANVPVIVHTIHGLPYHPYQSRMLNRLYIFLEREAARLTHKIISVADAMTRQALQNGVGRPALFVTIRSGMDLAPFLRRDHDTEKIRSRFNLKPEDLVVGKVARLFHLKGHEYLIQAASPVVKRIPSAKFLLIGDGILKEKLQEMVSQRGLANHFVFGGLAQPDEIPGLIAAMDLVVHVSIREGLAKVLPQALASGKPVISFDLDGACEVVDSGVNGFIIPPFDIRVLSDRIIRLLEDPALRRSMGEKGVMKVDPFYRKEYMIEKIDRLYREMLEAAACGR